MGSFLGDLARSWWSVELPGVRPHRARYATYSAFDWGRLPPMPGWVTPDYSWLASSPVHAESSLAVPFRAASRDLADWGDLAVQTVGARMPAEFLRVARDPALRRHLRSATDCYFHLGDHAVEVPGGWLVHFLSDSQWVRHWLLFAGAGEQAVVTTSFPAGFYMAVLDRKRDLVRRCLREQSADFQPTPLREPL